MKIACIGALVCALLLFTSAAFADSVDPRVGLGGTGSTFASCSESPTDPTCIQTGPTISGSVMVDNNGDAIVDVMNSTGQLLPSVTVTISSSIASALTCELEEGQNFFGSAELTASNACTFSGPPGENQTAGIPDGVTYGVYFFTWPADATVDFTVSSPVPEPGSLLLLGSGLIALAFTSKRIAFFRSNP
jgi:hypothetical protein